VPHIRLSSQRQDEELALEQEAGRRALARYAKRAQDQINAREKAKEGLPEFKTTQENPNLSPQQQKILEAEIAAGQRALEGAKIK
jgi:hypothetical protein